MVRALRVWFLDVRAAWCRRRAQLLEARADYLEAKATILS